MKTLDQQYLESVKASTDKLNKGLEKVLNLAGIKMVETTRSLIDKGGNYASRRLSNLTNYKIKNNVLTFGSNASNRGYNYGLAYEFGRKAGKFPNLTDIRKWVLRKYRLGLMQINRELGRTLKARIDTVAFLVGRAIKENGIKGKFHFQKGFEAGTKGINEKINKEILGAFA